MNKKRNERRSMNGSSRFSDMVSVSVSDKVSIFVFVFVVVVVKYLNVLQFVSVFSGRRGLLGFSVLGFLDSQAPAVGLDLDLGLGPPLAARRRISFVPIAPQRTSHHRRFEFEFEIRYTRSR